MNNAEKFIKIQSVESGNFSPQNNIINFVVPPATYDLKDSYVVLNFRTDEKPFVLPMGGGDIFPALVPYYLTHSGLGSLGLSGVAGDLPFNQGCNNGVLVRNARLTSDRVGVLEDIRNTNIIHKDIYERTNTVSEKISQKYTNVTPLPNHNDLLDTSYNSLKKVGTDISDLSANYEYHIPLSQFLRLGEMRQFNTEKMGDLRMRIELDSDKLVPVVYNWGVLGVGADNSAGYFPTGGFINTRMANFSDATTTLITQELLGQDLRRSPYFVGMSVEVGGSASGGGAGLSEPRVITQIEVLDGANQGKLRITLAKAVGVAGTDYTNVQLFTGDTVPDLDVEIELLTAELRLKKIPDVNMDMLQYITITNESDNGKGLKNYRTQYFVEPEAVGFYAIHTDKATDIINNGDKLQSYRIQIDQQDVTGNRDVVKLTSLEKELMNKTYLNLGLPLKNPSNNPSSVTHGMEGQKKSLNDNTNAPDLPPLFFIGSPLPMTPNRKIVDLQIDTDPATATDVVNSLEVFKFVVKSVKL